MALDRPLGSFLDGVCHLGGDLRAAVEPLPHEALRFAEEFSELLLREPVFV